MRPPACRRSSSRRHCGRRRVCGAKEGKKRNLTRGGMIRRVVNSTLEPTTTGLKVQRSNQLSYLCLKDRAVDGYFRRVTTGFRCGFREPARCEWLYFPRRKNPAGQCHCASSARILKELTRSPPSVAGVLYSDKRTEISAETGALGRCIEIRAGCLGCAAASPRKHAWRTT